MGTRSTHPGIESREELPGTAHCLGGKCAGQWGRVWSCSHLSSAPRATQLLKIAGGLHIERNEHHQTRIEGNKAKGKATGGAIETECCLV